MKKLYPFLTWMVCAGLVFSTSVVYGQCTATQTEAIISINSGTSFPEDIAWELSTGGSVVLSGTCASYSAFAPTSSDTFCFENGASYTLDLLDDFGDGWGGGASYSVTRTGDGCVITMGSNPNNVVPGDATTDCIGFDVEGSSTFTIDGPIVGCTSPAAINYNPCATVDDGSCLLPTVNDECPSAIVIPGNADGSCTLTASGTLIGASFSALAPPIDPSCFPIDTMPNDIWFVFQVPPSGNIQLSFGPTHDLVITGIEFFTGSCATLALHPILGCSFPFTPVSGLTPGEIVYVRVWDDFTLFGTPGNTVELCLADPMAGCTNPCAANYDSLAVVDDGSCALPPIQTNGTCATADLITAGSYAFYTGGQPVTGPTFCGFSDSTGLYYAYTVPATGVDTLRISTCGTETFHVIEVLSGCDSGAIQLACSISDGLGICDPFDRGVTLDLPVADLEGSTIVMRIGPDGGADLCATLVLEERGATCSSDNAPVNLVHLDNTPPGRVTLMWDPIPLSVACQVKGTRITPPGGSPTVNIFGPEPTSTKVPYTVAGAGTTWAWQVRCACSVSPVDATPFSVQDTFMVPVLRHGIAEFSLFPNPADQQIVVNLTKVDLQESNVLIFDMMGRLTGEYILPAGSEQLTIDVSGYTNGLYIIRVDGVDTRKFEVLHY